MKEESLAVAGRRCRKRFWLAVLNKTGEYFYLLCRKLTDCSFVFQRRVKPLFAVLFSETWVLPIITLLLIVAYSVVAIYFYIDV